MNKRLVGAIAVGVSIMAAYAFGVPLVQETWDAAGVAGWEIGFEPGDTAGGYGALSRDAVLGGPNGAAGALRIDAAGDTQPQIDYVFADGGSTTDFTGDYGTDFADPVAGIWFDFYIDDSNGSVPSALQLYFVGDGEEWYFDLTPQLSETLGWGTYGANINLSSPIFDLGQWVNYGSGDWTNDIANVSEIGIELSYTVSGIDQIYAIDNFTLDDEEFLVVPEPETYAFLAMAVLSLGLVFRQRVNESVQALFAQIRV
jgi:hypothetical protein